MTSRVRSILSGIPRHLHSKHVFLNPKTMSRWRDIDRMFKRARQAIGMEGLWFHDLRRYAGGRIMPTRTVELLAAGRMVSGAGLPDAA